MSKRLTSLFLILIAPSAWGQEQPPLKAPPSAARPAEAAAAVPTPAGSPDAENAIPNVDDEMLKPVPVAEKVLRSWREAVDLLRAQSTDIRSLQARVEVAQGQARQALAYALPTLTGNAALTHHLLRGDGERFGVDGQIPDPATAWNAGLNLRVPVLAPQVWYDRSTAEAAVGTAKLDVKAAERVVVAQVADAVVTTITAERAAEVSRVSLRSALATLDLNKRRAALGAASALDVLRVEQEVSLSRSQVVSADDGVLRAREALGRALGSSEPYGVTPDIRLDSLVADARNTCRPTNDVASRSDVLAAQSAVSVAERNVKSPDYSYIPSVDAVSSLTYWSDDDSTPNGEHVTWTIGGVLTWELYDGGLRYGQKETRRAELTVANEQLNDTRRRARLEVTQAYRAVRAAEATLGVAAKTRDLAAETARLSKVAYVNGTGTSFDLVDTARRQREAELDFAIKEFEVVRAKIAALLALSTCDI